MFLNDLNKIFIQPRRRLLVNKIFVNTSAEYAKEIDYEDIPENGFLPKKYLASIYTLINTKNNNIKISNTNKVHAIQNNEDILTITVSSGVTSFYIKNITALPIKITASSDIELYQSFIFIEPGNVIEFHIIGGKKVIWSDGHYEYRPFLYFYSEKTNGRLKRCHKYQIVDNRTKYDQPDYELVGGNIVPKATIITKTAPIEKIVVIATSSSTHTLQAWSLDYPKDYIEWDSSIIKTYVNEAPCTGKITFRRDSNGNETNGDNRGQRAKRYDRGGDEDYKWYYDSGSDGYDDNIPIFGADCFGNVFAKMSNESLVIIAAVFDVENNVFGSGNVNNKFGIFNINNTWGNNNVSNNWGNGNNNIFWGNSNTYNILGENNGSIIWGNGNNENNFGNNNDSNTFADSAICNTFLFPVNSTDFSSATHIYATYNCEIYFDATDGIKLRYMDEGAWVIADITD